MCNLDDIWDDRDKLLELREKTERRLKEFIPYRIRTRFVKCGNGDCWCEIGGNRHGPYLYALWRQDGKTHQRSLGLKFEQSALDAWDPARPDKKKVFRLSPDEYGKLTVDESLLYVEWELSDREFYERYGVGKDEDKFGRHRGFYALSDDYDVYIEEMYLYWERERIPQNRWARFGVGTLSGIAILEGLEKSGFYLKE